MRTTTLCALCLVAAVVVSAGSSSSSAPLIVQTVNGKIEGVESRGIRNFLGIPFAEPPLGDLRFKRPQPLQSNWTGVRPAQFFAPDCAQQRNGLAEFQNRSEDCLYLNVYASAEESSEPKPVMLFFYGGTWQWGGTSFFLYNGDALVRMAEDVVIVTTNYRLGPFGFLGSSALAAEDPQNSTGNAGFQDQRMAMQWVQENIAAFGGDPTAVTIWGESAGAGSVSAHLVAQQSWPYFSKAIMESGPPANWTTSFFDLAQEHFDRIADSLMCTGTDEQILSCLRNKTTQELLDNEENRHTDVPVAWNPTIDGVEFSRSPPQSVQRGEFHKVPILFGTNRNEGTLLTSCSHDANDTQYNSQFNQLFLNYSQEAQALYPIKDYGQPFFAVAEAFGDAGMSCPARRNAKWFSDYGSDVYLYFFTHEPVVTSWDPYLGVFHGSELLFVWDASLVLLPEEQALAEQFGYYWTSFAVTGNPNSNNTKVTWPKYEAATNQSIRLDLEISIDTNLKDSFCNFWDDMYYHTTGIYTPWGPWPGEDRDD